MLEVAGSRIEADENGRAFLGEVPPELDHRRLRGAIQPEVEVGSFVIVVGLLQGRERSMLQRSADVLPPDVLDLTLVWGGRIRGLDAEINLVSIIPFATP